MELLTANTQSMEITIFQYQTVPLMLVLCSLQAKYISITASHKSLNVIGISKQSHLIDANFFHSKMAG